MRRVLIVKSKILLQQDNIDKIQHYIDERLEKGLPILLPSGFDYEVVQIGDYNVESNMILTEDVESNMILTEDEAQTEWERINAIGY